MSCRLLLRIVVVAMGATAEVAAVEAATAAAVKVATLASGWVADIVGIL